MRVKRFVTFGWVCTACGAFRRLPHIKLPSIDYYADTGTRSASYQVGVGDPFRRAKACRTKAGQVSLDMFTSASWSMSTVVDMPTVTTALHLTQAVTRVESSAVLLHDICLLAHNYMPAALACDTHRFAIYRSFPPGSIPRIINKGLIVGGSTPVRVPPTCTPSTKTRARHRSP